MSGDNQVGTCCASCGIAEIDDIKLMPCDGCDLVKYCSDECREDHKSEHEVDCRTRAAELREELLFKQPEGTDVGDCPICCLPIPIEPGNSVIYVCCGKVICKGCEYANDRREMELRLQHKCPFCRSVTKSKKQFDKQLMKRVKANDPVAIRFLGEKYNAKLHYIRAFDCFTKAAELGDIESHFHLGNSYHFGQFVKKDEGKMLHHMEEAAIGGHAHARNNLGVHEWYNGDKKRAVKHWIIAATQGQDDSIEMVMVAYRKGLISKEDLASTLRAHKAAVDATKSPQRQAEERSKIIVRNNERATRNNELLDDWLRELISKC